MNVAFLVSPRWGLGFLSLGFYPPLQLLSGCPNNSGQQFGGPVYIPGWKEVQNQPRSQGPLLPVLRSELLGTGRRGPWERGWCRTNFRISPQSFVPVVSAAKNTPRSICQYSNMAPRLLGRSCKFAKFFFVSQLPVEAWIQRKQDQT